ncbi:hypothetical protein [Kocuria sp.]|uniref:hypothetical protein n=1 Tax=Kocuria sp. TaxID=1871328 RepID=UPI0026DCDCA8|nr:hypothetical protein [Kocuria sp.]MDO4919177.1 hypothetical protein [Kocuria sp.]
MPNHPRRRTRRIQALRDDLLQRGLPLVLEPRDRFQGVVPRSAPALFGVLILLVGLIQFGRGVEDVTEDELAGLSQDQAVAAGTGLLIMVCFPVGWWLLRVILRHVSSRVASVVGVVVVVALLVLPWLPVSGLELSVVDVLLILAVILLATYGGVGSVLAWASRRAAREMNHVGSMVGRVLPILMLALLFSFFNAEIWQVVAQLSMARTWVIVGVMGALGVALAILNARDEIARIVRSYDVHGGGPDLSPPERANITTMCVLISLIQVLLLGVVVFVFYVVFGVLSVSKVTATQWIGSPPAEFTGVLSGLPVSLPLVQVCMVLAAFSALNFIVSIGTDPTYRTTFLEPALAEVRQGLEVRDEYVGLRRGGAPQDHGAPWDRGAAGGTAHDAAQSTPRA